MSTTDTNEHSPSIKRLGRDLIKAAQTLSKAEARYLVDGYYIAQEARKRADNQVRSMEQEPHLLLSWVSEQNTILENQVKRALDSYTDTMVSGVWIKSLFGFGEVLAAGLVAHIDIERAPTVGHIHSFAGMAGSGQKPWERGEKRPWNAEFRTLVWKIGQCIMKFHKDERCYYGRFYRQRKDQEVANNEAGLNMERAAEILAVKRFKKTTDAYKAYSAGKFPPAHIDARARRFASKLFLSHLHTVMYWDHYKKLPPHPYPISHLDHAHYIPVPNVDRVDGLAEALRKFRA